MHGRPSNMVEYSNLSNPLLYFSNRTITVQGCAHHSFHRVFYFCPYTLDCCTVAFRSVVHRTQFSFFRLSVVGRQIVMNRSARGERKRIWSSGTIRCACRILYVHPVSQVRWLGKHFLWRATFFLLHFSLPQTRGGT